MDVVDVDKDFLAVVGGKANFDYVPIVRLWRDPKHCACSAFGELASLDHHNSVTFGDDVVLGKARFVLRDVVGVALMLFGETEMTDAVFVAGDLLLSVVVVKPLENFSSASVADGEVAHASVVQSATRVLATTFAVDASRGRADLWHRVAWGLVLFHAPILPWELTPSQVNR